MNSLKKALASLFALAIIFVSFSCGNVSDSGSGGNSGSGAGKIVDGLGFDLSNAKSFFAGKASSTTASRNAARSISDDSNVILMKIAEDGKILPAVNLQNDNIRFELRKILKNPATKELFLLGYFNKWSSGYYDDNNNYVESDGWNYNLIRVAQDGTWYGLPNFQNIQITQEPFDESGNFYFQGYDENNSQNIYKYSGSKATVIVKKGRLNRVLPNGAILYSVENQGMNYASYNYIRLSDGKTMQLDDYSTSIYIKDKNIFYYDIDYIRKNETNYYVDDTGNKYDHCDGSDSVYYANKGGKKIYVTKVDGRWEDESGNSYDSHVFSSGYFYRYYIFDDVGNKIDVKYFYGSYCEDNDGNRYESYDVQNSEEVYYIYDDSGNKIFVKQIDDHWEDENGNSYDYYPSSEWVNHYYVFKNGKKIEVEYFSYNYYEDSDGNRYDHCDKQEYGTWHWVYKGGETVKVKHNEYGYEDDDGNKYDYEEVYSDYEYYVNTNGNKVIVKPAQNYDTDVLVAKYYDFIANEKQEAVAEANFSEISTSYSFATASENVFGTTFITNNLWKFEIQDDFSLKCKYNLSEKGYTVATSWDSSYNFIGDNTSCYLEKFLFNGDKIYFLGTKGDAWSSNASYNLYKIIRFGEPVSILLDASNYAFNGNITFDNDGNFIGSVLRKSDGKWGTLSGSMEYGAYEFKADDIFESVTDIVINFD